MLFNLLYHIQYRFTHSMLFDIQYTDANLMKNPSMYSKAVSVPSLFWAS